MADNGTPEPFDPRMGAELNPDTAEWDAIYRGQSRRKFLRNALIGSAAATAVVGTATTLIVTGAGATPAITKKLTASQQSVSPPPLESSMCVTYTTPPLIPAPCFGNGTDTNGDFWVFFTIFNVPGGITYSAEIDQNTIGATITASSTPFKFDNSSAVHVSVGGSPATCPTTVPGTAQSSADPVPVTVPAGPNQDVQVAFHIKLNGAPTTGTYTFFGTLKNGATLEAESSIGVVYPCP
jgi:hypothetical protein